MAAGSSSAARASSTVLAPAAASTAERSRSGIAASVAGGRRRFSDRRERVRDVRVDAERLLETGPLQQPPHRSGLRSDDSQPASGDARLARFADERAQAAGVA